MREMDIEAMRGAVTANATQEGFIIIVQGPPLVRSSGVLARRS